MSIIITEIKELESMTIENLRKVSNNVKCCFARLIKASGYKESDNKHYIKPELIESFSSVMGHDFNYGVVYENVRVLQKDGEEGIQAIENGRLTFRSFINLKDGSPKVFRSMFVGQTENPNESYMSVRFFSEDQSLIVVNAKTRGNRSEIKELCAYVYDSETIGRCIESIPNFNPCEIGEDIRECMMPSRILILLPSAGIKDAGLLQKYLSDYSRLSEVLILFASNITGGEIPYEFVMNAEVLTSLFDAEKRKTLF
jgi:hypothetical protein